VDVIDKVSHLAARALKQLGLLEMSRDEGPQLDWDVMNVDPMCSHYIMSMVYVGSHTVFSGLGFRVQKQ
jgi:hypothetical protein